MDKQGFTNNIIDRIQAARIKAKLSCRKLSQLIGRNDSYINRLENNRNFLPSMLVLSEIIKACKLTINQFFYYDFDAYNKDRDLMKLLKHVNSDQKDAIITLLQNSK